MKQDIRITAGKWLFRHRSFTPLPLLVLCLLLFRPQGRLSLLTVLGLAVSLLGEALRMVAVGWSHGGTSGREAYLRADRLNILGIYSLTRNPLYIGNILIFFGLTIVFGNPLVSFLMVLFLIAQYQLIVYTEEQFLLAKYGAEYTAYMQAVPRFIPRLKGFASAEHPFSWRKVLYKENDSVFNLGLVFWVLHHYRIYLQGRLSWQELPFWLPLLLWISLYVLIKWFKKRYGANL